MLDLGDALYGGNGCMEYRAAAVKWWRRGAEAGHEGCKARLANALLAGEDLDTAAAADTEAPCWGVAAPMTTAAAAGDAGLDPPALPPAAGALEAQQDATDGQALSSLDNIPDALLTDAWIKACKQGNLMTVRELLALSGDRRVNLLAGEEAAFCGACGNGHLAVVRELLSLSGDRRVNVHAGGEDAFYQACCKGQLGVVRELLALTGNRRVDVHAGGEEAFRQTCRCGHLAVVRELLGLTGNRRVDVHVRGEAAFQEACVRGHLAVVRELLALTGDRVVRAHHPAAAALLAAGPAFPASPPDAALWAGVTAHDGLMRSGAADGRMVSAARGGCVVWSWGRRWAVVGSRVGRRW